MGRAGGGVRWTSHTWWRPRRSSTVCEDATPSARWGVERIARVPVDFSHSAITFAEWLWGRTAAGSCGRAPYARWGARRVSCGASGLRTHGGVLAGVRPSVRTPQPLRGRAWGASRPGRVDAAPFVRSVRGASAAGPDDFAHAAAPQEFYPVRDAAAFVRSSARRRSRIGSALRPCRRQLKTEQGVAPES